MKSPSFEIDLISQRPFPLSKKYTKTNDTYIFQEGCIPCIGHNKQLTMLKQQLLHTEGGAFLVTGFRGVGKTTLVNNAIAALSEETPGKVLDVKVTFSAEKTYTEILFELSEGIHNKVCKSQLINNLPTETKNRIAAISERIRNSSIKHQRTNATEIGGSITASNPLPSVTVSLNPKVSRNESTELVQRELTPSVLEKELREIIEEINCFSHDSKFIFVIDEIDKLTQDSAGKKDFEMFLNQSKSIICSLKAVFVFIAGIDVYEKWKTDSRKIDSIYASVFHEPIYLPCVWDTAIDLFELFEEKECVFEPVPFALQDIVARETIKQLRPSFEIVNRYLILEGKGLPQRILDTFNSMVVWDGDQPYFYISEEKSKRILQLYSLFKKFQKFRDNANSHFAANRDAYYMLFLSLLDCLIELDGMDFSESDVSSMLLMKKDIGKTLLNVTSQNLLKAFEKEHIIIPKTTAEMEFDNQNRVFTITDGTIQSMKNIEKGEEEIILDVEDESPVVTDSQLQNTIDRTRSSGIKSFWSLYSIRKTYEATPHKSVLLIEHRNTHQLRIATVYNTETFRTQKIESLGNTNLFEKHQLLNGIPGFSNTDVLLLNGTVFSIVQDPVSGMALSDLVSAGLKNDMILKITAQLCSISKCMVEKGLDDPMFSSDNVIVRRTGEIKIINILKLFSPQNWHSNIKKPAEGKKTIPGQNSVFSIGLVLLEMLSVGAFVYAKGSTIIEGRSIIKCGNYSQKLTTLVSDMIDPDSQKRPILCNGELQKRLHKCPEFRRCTSISITNPLLGPINIRPNDMDLSTEPGTHVTPDPLDPTDTESFKTVCIKNQSIFDVKGAESVKKRPRTNERVHPMNEKDNRQTIPENRIAHLFNPFTNEIVPVSVSPFYIGRQNADYCIEDPLASRIHAKICFTYNHYYIYDLQTPNGTFVDNRKLTPNNGSPLGKGATINIAQTKLYFSQDVSPRSTT